MIIRNDVHDIANRIREVDSSYYIIFDSSCHRFKLYGGKEQGYIMTLPYDRLDERTVEYVRKTRVERMDAMIDEMEKYNRALELEAKKDAMRASEEQIYTIADRVLYERND